MARHSLGSLRTRLSRHSTWSRGAAQRRARPSCEVKSTTGRRGTVNFPVCSQGGRSRAIPRSRKHIYGLCFDALRRVSGAQIQRRDRVRRRVLLTEARPTWRPTPKGVPAASRKDGSRSRYMRHVSIRAASEEKDGCWSWVAALGCTRIDSTCTVPCPKGAEEEEKVIHLHHSTTVCFVHYTRCSVCSVCSVGEVYGIV